VGHVSGVIGVSGCPSSNAAQEIAGNDYVSRSSADSLAGTLSKRIYAAWAHVAVSAAQPQLSKAALRLLFFIAIPGSLQTGSLAYVEHLPAGGIYRPIANILCHINTSNNF
jgi:hypothetical protein